MNFSINQSSSLSFIEQAQKKHEEETEKLSSGFKINRAADDAAGLQISNRLTSQINGLDQQAVNSRDQINLNNVASAQLSSITSSLQRANELAVQAGSPLSDSSAIQGELDQITGEINAIAGQALGNDSFISGLDANDPAASLAAVETALASVGEQASSLGAQSNGLQSQISTYEITSTNSSAARSRIRDTDFAQSTSEQQKNDILLQASLSIKKTEEERKGLLFNQMV
ncbi:flagellin [Psychrobium sp. MM17-31]|uniref:flagellin n=1 Tax=Psychrobium sp. MM17-31 TaxID=2917758 RepID=UPI001EF43253|nr:flagellin [Psychrobium sp. MM17-31]MCG7532421.1 flagellin [Psychrobium sp. MM17-31]